MSPEAREDSVALYLLSRPDVAAGLFALTATPGAATPPSRVSSGVAQRGRGQQFDDLPQAQQAVMRARFMRMWEHGDPKRGRSGSDAAAIAWALDPDA
jgi:hypothetical protein